MLLSSVFTPLFWACCDVERHTGLNLFNLHTKKNWFRKRVVGVFNINKCTKHT